MERHILGTMNIKQPKPGEVWKQDNGGNLHLILPNNEYVCFDWDGVQEDYKLSKYTENFCWSYFADSVTNAIDKIITSQIITSDKFTVTITKNKPKN